MEFFFDGSRWWCVQIYWDSERPGNPIPAKYLREIEIRGVKTGPDRSAERACLFRARYRCAEPVNARKTRSSTGMDRVKTVGTVALETPTAMAELETAGPAGLVSSELVSPGMTDNRVVLGVQGAVAPKQVSRTKIWR